jgi:hypothetical protein
MFVPMAAVAQVGAKDAAAATRNPRKYSATRLSRTAAKRAGRIRENFDHADFRDTGWALRIGSPAADGYRLNFRETIRARERILNGSLTGRLAAAHFVP